MNNDQQICERCGRVEEGGYIERGIYLEQGFVCECCEEELEARIEHESSGKFLQQEERR